MIKIALLRLDSGRHDKVHFEKDRGEFLAPLSQEFTLLETRPGDQAEADLQVVFIASGGSEQEFRRIYPGLAKPVILLADGKHNSLPAALEISSWVRQQGEAAEIVHGESSLIAGRLRRLAGFQRTRRALAGRIGLIGEPSDWLIASSVDRAAVNALWGTEFIDIALDEVSGHKAKEAEVAALAREWIQPSEKTGRCGRSGAAGCRPFASSLESGICPPRPAGRHPALLQPDRTAADQRLPGPVPAQR